MLSGILDCNRVSGVIVNVRKFSVGRARYQHLYVGRGYVDCASGVRGIQTGFVAFEAQLVCTQL
jgi:hypothetical protein